MRESATLDIRPPTCQERGCSMRALEDSRGGPIRYQHGENPEAVLEIAWHERGMVRATTAWQYWLGDVDGVIPPALVEEWVERVHAYEDGET